MEDSNYVHFLQWALPRLQLRWRGFRKVRRQVCRRIDRRIAELKLTGLDSYRKYLEDTPDEWRILDQFCRITISRFYRDSVVFDYLGSDVLPALATSVRGKNIETIRLWSGGCASGEEAYTMAILWHFLMLPRFPGLRLEIIATDIDPVMIRRGKAARYPMSSLRSLPPEWLAGAFEQRNGAYCLKDPFKESVRFKLLDIRSQAPAGKFHLIFCRNLALTYFEQDLQLLVLKRFHEKIERGGVLVTGTHERTGPEMAGFRPWVDHLPIFQKS